MIDVTPYLQTIDDKPLAVFGLARSGLSTIKALTAAGADVIAWDDNEDARDKAAELGARIEKLTAESLKTCTALILAPGVPLHFPEPHEVVLAARAAGIEIICDIELFYRCVPDDVTLIGITGTNGKSTTTALLGHTLNHCGMKAIIGGNIGKPILGADLTNISAVVLELSSYQLDLCPTLALDIAVLLNVSPDHLDRHGSMQNYIAAKMRIFKDAGYSICGVDDLPSQKICEGFAGMAISMNDDIGNVENPNLRGDHNRQNMAAVIAVAKHLELPNNKITEALNSFAGLPHRQFLVREIGNVLYVNDSKATNAEASEKALQSFQDIFWILGGQAKEGGLDGLENLMGWVKHSFIIGEAAPEFAQWMDQQNCSYTISETLDKAVLQAHEMAQENAKGVVLLSPACASWDQYKSFEHRGDEFVKLVGRL